jgi:hypothetical protein
MPMIEGKHCATLEQLQYAPVPLFEVPKREPNRSGKEERDATCDCPNQLYSDNFVVKWGSGVSENDAQNVLDLFEIAWEIEHEQMGYEAPVGSDDYYFNIYIGDSGGGTPGGFGAAGYFTLDQEGYPLIVIAKNTLSVPDYLHTTIAHEFFHALQGVTMRYDYDTLSSGSWYWEATANWVEGYVYPTDVNVGGFLIGYSFFPHFPVNYFNYPDTGALDEYHQYGAFIFPHHLSEVEADADLIRISWQDQGADDDPMEVLDEYLLDYGTTIEEAWLNHIARHTVMDYAQGDAYSQLLDYYGSWYSESENRIAVEVMQEGSLGWKNGPTMLRPMRFGHNVIKASGLTDQQMTFSIRGDELGSLNSVPEFGARVVRERSGSIEYFSIDVENNEGTIAFDDVSSGDVFYLVVGVWTADWQENKIYSEDFSYQYSIGPTNGNTEEPSSEPQTNTGSGFYDKDQSDFGCSGVANNSTKDIGLYFLLLSVLLTRRKENLYHDKD